MAIIGADNLVYAVMTDIESETYGTVKPFKKLKMVDINPTTETVENYYDDQLGETITVFSGCNVTLEVDEDEVDIRADLLGETLDANKVLISKSTDAPQYVAIGFKSLMSDQVNYAYKWLYKGKFSLPQEQAKTKGKTPEMQSRTLTGTFMPREKDKQWQATVKSNQTGIGAKVIEDWFKVPYGETVPSA